MRRLQFLGFFVFLLTFQMFAQQANVVGRVFEDVSGDKIPEANVRIEESNLQVETEKDGSFTFNGLNLPLGEHYLIVEHKGFSTQRYSIVIYEGETLHIGDLFLTFDSTQENLQISTISLAASELGGDDVSISNISGLLASSKDIYLKAAAYDFSAAFFNPRGLENSKGKILINGLEMNKLYSGRPKWGNWGGLNDVQRNRVFTRNTKASDYNFGGLGGTSNIIMRASEMRRGGRVSYASANRSYQGRVVGNYNSGTLEGGWSYSLLLSRRFGEEGYKKGTLYDANSFFLAVEKEISEKHSLNLTGFYTPVRRGMSTLITEEVADLKGIRYNPNWGDQDGDQRNSKMRKTEEPVFMLNHYWEITDDIKLNTNVGYQTGFSSTTRIDNGGTRLEIDSNTGEPYYPGGARNPMPNYYQNLPSYHLQNPQPTPTDFQRAYAAEKKFVNDGQLDWKALYRGNRNFTGTNSVYAIQSDRVEDSKIMANSILTAKINENITLNARLNYLKLRSENFARMEDLLGGQGFLDVDFFAEESAFVTGIAQDLAQSDLRNPNRIVTEKERYKYNYKIDAETYDAFAQLQFKYKRLDFYLGGQIGQTNYQRTGLYENGFFPGEASYGKGEKINLTTFGGKVGGVYKITGRHLLDMNLAYTQEAPTIRNSYSNVRQNHEIIDGLKEVKSQSLDLSYIYKSPLLNLRATGFYVGFQDETDVAFYFTEDLTGLSATDGSAFVQEIMSGIERKHYGVEFGAEMQILSTLELKVAGSIGHYIYDNNPDLYLTSQDFPGTQLRFGDGQTDMKKRHVPGGPERVFQLGLTYRNPSFWNVGITANHFSNSYITPSGLLRSDNFALDYDAVKFANYNEEEARHLLKQEKFDDYVLVNLIGGKSWRVGNKYIGFFAVVNNIFDEIYKTGGFEQTRKSNFMNRSEDFDRDNGALFGNQHYYGSGTTYYLNVYCRF